MESIKKHNSQIYVLAVLLSCILSIVTINRIKATVEESPLVNNLLVLILLFVFSLFLLAIKNFYPKSNIIRSLFFFVLFTIPVILFSFLNISHTISAFLTIAFFPLALVLGSYFGKQLYLVNKPDLLIFILMFPSVLGSLYVLNSPIFNQAYLELRDYIFPIIVFFPLILYYRSPLLKYASLLFFGYIFIISAKKSAIIVYALIFLIVVFSSFVNFKKITFKKFIIVFFILSIFVTISLKIYYVNQEAINIAVARFSLPTDNATSGRDVIYHKVLDEIKHANAFNFLFGHGYAAVQNNLFEHPAHNDLLEILYDFGILSLLCYLIFLTMILYKTTKLFFHQKKYGTVYVYIAGSVITIIILGLLNCIVTNASYVFVNMFILGISLEYSKNVIYGHRV